MNNSVSALILAAGSGSRMKLDITKQKLNIMEKSVLRRSLEAFDFCDAITEIIVVCRADEIEFAKAEALGLSKVKSVVVGGKTRTESAKCGLLAVSDGCEYVAVHDAARCLVSDTTIKSVINDAVKYGAATASTTLIDSVKRVDEDSFVETYVDRATLRLVQTPQIFRKDLYKKAMELTDVADPLITDDNMLMEKIGVKVYCTECSRKNIKITEVGDLEYAEFLLSGGNKND